MYDKIAGKYQVEGRGHHWMSSELRDPGTPGLHGTHCKLQQWNNSL